MTGPDSPALSQNERRLPGDASPALASSAVVAAVFSIYGLHGPYFPVWLGSRGLSKSEIAFVIGTPLVARLLITPLVGRFADSRSDRRALIATMVTIAALAMSLALHAQHFALLFLASCTMMLCCQAMQPVVDATVGSLVRSRTIPDFGRIRLWGSASFAVVAVCAGFVLNARGIESAIVLYFLLFLATFAASYWLPSAGGESKRAVLKPFRLHHRPALLLVLICVGLINASQAMFYGFGSMQMLALGYPDWSIGLLWTVAVAAEIIVLWFAPTMLARLGPYRLLLVATVCTTFRWIGMGFDPTALGTAALQMLHAGTLSCTYLALMAFIQRFVEEEATARAQSASVTMTGLMMAGMVVLTGPIYQSLGGKAYWVAALLPALATLLLIAGKRRLTA